MEKLHDILMITIPSLMVFLAAFLAMRSMISNDQDKRRQELILQNSRTITPIKLQAYERIVLFLERISIESLVVRTNSPGMSAAQLHSALLNNIRSEFEHNLSQQIYMTQQAWEVVKNARSNTIKIINTVFEKAPENSTSLDLSRKLLEQLMEIEKEPTKTAIEYIKNELNRIM
jgi:methylthioribose-1-phosphate isomerase